MRANRKMRANRNARKPKNACKFKYFRYFKVNSFPVEYFEFQMIKPESLLSWCWSDLGILEFSKKSEFWSLPGILEAFRYLGTTNLLLNESLSHCKNCEIELETRKGTFGFEVYYSCRWPWYWSDKNRMNLFYYVWNSWARLILWIYPEINQSEARLARPIRKLTLFKMIKDRPVLDHLINSLFFSSSINCQTL